MKKTMNMLQRQKDLKYKKELKKNLEGSKKAKIFLRLLNNIIPSEKWNKLKFIKPLLKNIKIVENNNIWPVAISR